MTRHRRSSLCHTSLRLCLIAVLLPAAGCATSGRHDSVDGQLLSEQSASFVQDNTVGGATTGAVIGCIAGILLDAAIIVATNGNASPAIGCAISGAAGAVAGGVDGYTQGKGAQAKANQVLLTRSITTEIEKENAGLHSAAQTVQRVVESDQKKLAQIKSDLAAKAISLDNAQVQAAFIRKNTTQISSIIDDARKKRVNFLAARERLQGSDITALDQQIAQFDTEIAQLETQLASVNASLTLTPLNQTLRQAT
jgi:hypothetical protein